MALLMFMGCENPTDTPVDNTDSNTDTDQVDNDGFDPQTTLDGSDYFLLQMDESSYSYLATTGATITNLRIDDTTRHLYYWDDTVVPGTSDGSNFYDLPQDWISVSVADIGWSGMGHFISETAENVDMSAAFTYATEYYLHLAVKGNETSDPIVVILNDGQTEVKIALGGDFVDDGTTYESYLDIPKDNEWHSLEIPMTYLNELGLTYDTPFNNVNIIAFLMGGTEGTTFDVDAVFFYRK